MTRRARRTVLAVLAAAGMAATSVVVPTAQAAPAPSTPDTLALAGSLAGQQISWSECDFDSGLSIAISEELRTTPGLACASVIVPLDWHNPGNGKTMRLRISRVQNLDLNSPDYRGTILVNPGGPGGAALHWAPLFQRRAPQVRANFNMLGIDPRGVGASDHPSCVADYAGVATEKDLARVAAQACSKVEAVQKITSEQTSYDFDFVRGLLGIPKITYVGYSYGTWLGKWYGSLFGPHIERMILDSALDGTMPTLQGGWDLQPVARNRQFEDAMIPYAVRNLPEYLAARPESAAIAQYLPKTNEQMLAAYWHGYDTFAKLAGESSPLILWLYTGALSAFPDPTAYPGAQVLITLFAEMGTRDYLDNGQLPPWLSAAGVATPRAGADYTTEATALLDRIAATSSATERAGIILDAFHGTMPADLEVYLRSRVPAAAGDAGQATDLREAYSAFDAIRCGDGQWTQGEQYWDAWDARIKAAAPFARTFGQMFYPQCAWWPTTNPTMPAADPRTFPPTLVIQAEEDSQTGYEGGLRTGTKLPNTQLIAIDNATKHGYFPYGTNCVDKPGFAFLQTGTLPQQPVSICLGKPLPAEDRVYEMWSPLNVNGRHVPGNASFPSRVQDPQTGNWDVSTEAGRRLIDQALRHVGR